MPKPNDPNKPKRLLPRNQPGHVRRQQTLVMDGKILKLRIAGYSYSAIAEALDISQSTAFDGLHRALIRHQAVAAVDAEAARRLEVERLDNLLTKLSPSVERGDPQAALRVIQISKRRSELMGLDAPTKTEVGNLGGQPFAHKITVEFV